jgi:hypothetical protein
MDANERKYFSLIAPQALKRLLNQDICGLKSDACGAFICVYLRPFAVQIFDRKIYA